MACPSYTKEVNGRCVIQNRGAFEGKALDQRRVLTEGELAGQEVGKCDAHGSSSYELIPTSLIFKPEETKNFATYWDAVPGTDLVFVVVDKPKAGNLCVNLGNQSDARSKLEGLLDDKKCEALFIENQSQKCEVVRSSLQRKYKSLYREDPPMGTLESLREWVRENKNSVIGGTLIFGVLVPLTMKLLDRGGGGGHGGGGGGVDWEKVGREFGKGFQATSQQETAKDLGAIAFLAAGVGMVVTEWPRISSALTSLGGGLIHVTEGAAGLALGAISITGFKNPMAVEPTEI